MNKIVRKQIREFLDKEGIRISCKKRKFFFKNWTYLSMFPVLSESFLRKYKTRLRWGYVSWYNNNLSERFIYEYQHRLNVETLQKRGLITPKRLDELEFLMREKITRFEIMEIEE